MKWNKGILQWRWAGTLYLSVPFTWQLPSAREVAAEYRHRAKHPVRAGGPAVELLPDYLAGVADTTTPLEIGALQLHNPFACRTSQGCPYRCAWCINRDRPLELLPKFEPRPLVCDDNFLACPWPHIERAMEKLGRLPFVDFNQGLDASLFSEGVAALMAQLRQVRIRFAWDRPAQEKGVRLSIRWARAYDLADIRCYVMIGYPRRYAGYDTPEYARYRCETLRQLGVLPNVQRFQPVRVDPAHGIEMQHLLRKNSYIAPAWTGHELGRFARYWNRQVWFRKVPYDEFCRHAAGKEDP